MTQERQHRPGNGPERVYQDLRRSIIEQKLPPGTRLPEDAVALRHGVSRTVLRSAFERLISEGLVDRSNNRSARVASIGLEGAADLLDIRQDLEAMVIARLAGRLGPPEVARLHAHVGREEHASSLNTPEAVRLAGEFHMLLAELTGSALLSRYVSDVVSRSSVILTGHTLPHSSSCAVREHHELIELIQSGECRAAQDAMRTHLALVVRRGGIVSQAADVNGPSGST